MRLHAISIATLVDLIVLAPVVTSAASFTPLGDLPGGDVHSSAQGVSADGSVIVGESSSSPGLREAFRWSRETGMVGLGELAGGPFYSTAYGVSGDGRVVVGASAIEGGVEAFAHTPEGGMIGLGDLPGDEFGSEATDASLDGSIIVGHSFSSVGIEVFRWENGVMSSLGIGLGGTRPAVSDDGSVIVGDAAGEAFRWVNGATDFLGTLPGRNGSMAFDVSAAGDVVVGHAGFGGHGNEAFRWTAETGMVGLGYLNESESMSRAFAVSGDGSVVVGESKTSESNWRAFIWDAENGMRDLGQLLENVYGVNMDGWTLTQAIDISADGRVIVGNGTGPSGGQAWVAVIPEPGTAILLGLGLVGLSSVRLRV